jgi:hypothetical protein
MKEITELFQDNIFTPLELSPASTSTSTSPSPLYLLGVLASFSSPSSSSSTKARLCGTLFLVFGDRGCKALLEDSLVLLEDAMVL